MDSFETTDVFGDSVRLTPSRWQGHILAAHPEMAQYLAHIRDAIEGPHCVYQSETGATAKLFYQRGKAQGMYRNLYLKVVVGYSMQPAEVKTAFFTTGLTGGRLLWIRFP